ncbi:MAG TPA: hypothetical protein PK263_04100 [bacterium]|nr:hypothetical protein [bacterium]
MKEIKFNCIYVLPMWLLTLEKASILGIFATLIWLLVRSIKNRKSGKPTFSGQKIAIAILVLMILLLTAITIFEFMKSLQNMNSGFRC